MDQLTTRLSTAQTRFWLAGQAHGERVNRIAIGYDLLGPLDSTALERALVEVTTRHETLCSAYAWSAAGPVRRPAPAAGLIRLGAPRDASQREAVDLADAAVDLDPGAGRVFQPVLVRHDEGHHLLAFVVHHIAFDGASEPTLLADLAHAYGRRLARQPVEWADEPRYGAFVAWEEARLGETQFAEHLRYWRDSLADARVRPLRHLGGGDAGGQTEVQHIERVLDIEATRLVTAQAVAIGVSPGMHLLACQARALLDGGGGEEVVIGCEVSLRHLYRQPVVGPVLNTVPLRFAAHDDVHAQARSGLLGSLLHAHVPLNRILAQHPALRAPSRDRSPLEYLAVHAGRPEPVPTLPGLCATRILSPRQHSVVPLTVATAMSADRRIRLRAYFRRHAYDPAAVREHLRAVAADAEGRGANRIAPEGIVR